MKDEMALEVFQNEFECMGINFPKTLHSKAIELCEKHALSVEEFVETWFAYKHSHSKTVRELNLSTLEALERERLEASKKTPKNKVKKRLNDTSLDGTNKVQAMGGQGTPLRITSTNTPSSAKFSSRKDRGKVLVSTDQSDDMTQYIDSSLSSQSQKWSRKDPLKLCQVLNYYNDHLKVDTQYMYQRFEDKRNVLIDLIKDMKELYIDASLVEFFEPIRNTFQDQRHVIGRICTNQVEEQILLEDQYGNMTGLNLSSLNDYMLLPGQVVALECTNPKGDCLNVSKLIENIYPPMADIPSLEDEISMVVACGPYTTQDSLCYEPLDELISNIQSECPDVCVMLGPFMDSKMAETMIKEDLEGVYQKIMDKIVATAERLNIHVVIVPSQRDFLHEPVYPQPPFKHPSSTHVTFASDPATLLIDKHFVVAVTSTDILFHASKNIIAKTQGSTDRMTRLLQCLFSQHNYYPLYPSSSEVNMDLTLFDLYGRLDVTPHVLITPSELKHFVKSVNGCTCVNPGRLAKSESGGTYAKLMIKIVKNDNNHLDSSKEEHLNNDEKENRNNNKINIDVQIVKV